MAGGAVMHWVSSVPLGVTISVIGVLGNAISVCIWYRILKKKIDRSSATSIYLIALGIIDCCLLVFFLLTNSIPSGTSTVVNSYAFAVFYSYIGFPLLYFFIVSSIWLLVGVTMSRFLIVTTPVKARFWCTPFRTLLSIAALLSFSFVINIPHFFNYHPGKINGTYHILETQYAKTGGSKIYEFWVHCMFLVLVPWLALVILNGSIMWSMRQRAVKSIRIFGCDKSKRDQRVKQQHQITKTLLSVTFAFIILLSWQCITQCLWMIGYSQDDEKWNLIDKSFAFAKLGIVINSSVNWLLYCLTGSSFRKEIVKLFQYTSMVAPEEIRSSSSSRGTGNIELSLDYQEKSVCP